VTIAAAVHPDDRFAALLARPGVEERCELRSPIGVMAYHGGALEQVTDLIADAAACAAGASYYGVVQPDGLREHVPSIAVRPTASAALAAFLAHVEVVVTVHGYGRRDRFLSLLLGGTNRRLAEHVAAHLRPALPAYSVVTDLDDIPTELRGLHPHNPVNVPRHGGVQIELPPRVRGISPFSPPPGADGLSPPTRALIDALAASISSWPGGRRRERH
jgi:phage replication-related protein YjqB (UPF0714/DUF867 family)